MAAKKKGPPDDRSNARTSDESEIVSLYRGFSNEKSGESGAILSHTTLSVWAATFILCSVLVFGLHQVRGRLDGIQATLERSEQDKKLLLEGMDELLVRADRPNQIAAITEPPDQEAETTPAPKQKEQIKLKKSEPNDLARKYKIYYRTKDGEDLAQISRKFNVSEDQLRLWNALKSSDSLVTGQVLVINKSTKTDKPVVVAKAPSPPEAKRVEKKKEPVVKEPAPQKLVTTPPPRPEAKQDDAAAEETPVVSPDSTGGTGDSLAAGGGEPTLEVPETPSAEPVGETVHVVQEGESLSAIGQNHGVSWLALATWNNIEPPGTIYVGQRLRIPEISEPAETSPSTSEVAHGEAANSEVTHKVQRGENLYRIGRLYDLTWKQVAQANGITDPSQIYEGQVLKIPAAQGAPEE